MPPLAVTISFSFLAQKSALTNSLAGSSTAKNFPFLERYVKYCDGPLLNAELQELANVVYCADSICAFLANSQEFSVC